MRRITETVAFVALLAIWGLTPLLILWLLVSTSTPPLTSQVLFYATIVWSTASVALFGVLLHHHDYFETQNVDSLLGLTCTLVVGIPAMAFSALPMVGSPADFLQTLNPEGHTVPLQDLKEDGSKTLYVVGIDVSKSFVAGPADARLAEVFDAFNSFFYASSPDSFAASQGNDDALHAYVFAKSSEPVLRVEDALQRRQQIPEFGRMVEASFTKNLDRDSTDLVKFLNENVCGEIEAFGKNAYVKVIIFSDWIQSYPKENVEAYLQDQRIRLKSFQNCVKGHGNVAFLEFRAPALDHKERQPDNVDADIGRQLRYGLGEERWQHLDLQAYNRARPEEKPTLPSLIYSNNEPAESVYLKYLPDPGWKPFISQITLPGTDRSEKLFISFRPLTPDASPVRVYLKPGNNDEVVIDMNEQDRAAQITTESGPLQLKLAQRTPGSRDARIEMLIAVPRRSTVYRIPVVVLPVMREDAIKVLKWVVFAMHLLPIVLAARILRSRAQRLRQKTVVVPVSS